MNLLLPSPSGFLEDVSALDQRVNAPHCGRMRRLRDRGERGDRDRRSRQVVLDEEQQQVPGRVLFGDRNQLLERLTDPFEKRDDPQEFVFGHPIARSAGLPRILPILPAFASG